MASDFRECNACGMRMLPRTENASQSEWESETIQSLANAGKASGKHFSAAGVSGGIVPVDIRQEGAYPPVVYLKEKTWLLPAGKFCKARST